MDDNQIIALYWSWMESAITETAKKYGGYCLSVADNILSNREDAKECVNDTWLRAWQTIPPTRPVQLKLFLAKITRNLSFDKWKERYALKKSNVLVILSRTRAKLRTHLEKEGYFL